MGVKLAEEKRQPFGRKLGHGKKSFTYAKKLRSTYRGRIGRPVKRGEGNKKEE